MYCWNAWYAGRCEGGTGGAGGVAGSEAMGVALLVACDLVVVNVYLLPKYQKGIFPTL